MHKPDEATKNTHRTQIIHATVDITAETCPMTYVRTRVALAQLLPGQLLQVRLCGRDPEISVPANARRQGHAIIGSEKTSDGATLLYLRRAGH